MRRLQGDPEYLHHGRPVRLLLNGTMTDFFTIASVAAAVGRSTGTVRRWLREGRLAETPYRTPGRGPRGQKRLWRREDVLALARLHSPFE